jgi:hypothetical protein
MKEFHEHDLIKDTPKHLEADVGDLIRIVLMENSGTGYKWLINHDLTEADPSV